MVILEERKYGFRTNIKTSDMKSLSISTFVKWSCFICLQSEKSNLELDLSEMQEDIHSIFLTSRCVTVCTLIPIIGRYPHELTIHI